MYRRLALAGLLATASTQAYALGLGPIKLHSGLNQPLDADVELLSGNPQELSQLRVALAPNAAFQQAGVQRTMLLTRLNFKVVKRPSGGAVIHISSPMPIREPFLDFVLEVDWGGGQLMREYTVLINPPTFMAHAAPPPAPSTSTAAARSTQTAPPAPAQATPTMSQAAAGAGEQAHAGQYGPTQRTDTLWKIAGQVRPDDRVSREQAMLSLLRANPNAFYDGNINRLKAGYVLRVPARSDMVSVARPEARQQVAKQNAEWREARKTGTVERQASTKPAAGPSQGGRLKLLAPEPEQGASAAAGGPAEAGSATGAAGTTAAAGNDVATLRNKLNAALEAADAQRQQTADLQAQVAGLEKQIQSMHHLIEMRDGKLAQLQGQSAAATSGAAAPAPSAAAAASAAGASAESTAGAEPGTPQAGAASVGTTPAPASAAAAKPEAAAKPQAESPAPAQPAPEASKPAVQTAPPVAAKPAPVKAAPTPPAAQPTIWDELLANPMMVGLGGAAGLLVLLLGWASMRRRRMAMTEFQESILAAEQAGGLHAAADAGGAVADSGDSGDGASGESSLLSDFAVSDMDAIQSEGEADPLAEADVYLAYGRYQQAEELVSEALKNAPERNDLHMKLLEIYHAAQNATAFDGQAEAFLARLDSQEDPFWARVAEMGREISPDNPLYKSDSAGEAAKTVAPVMDMPETEDAAPVEDHSNELDAPELMAAVQDSGVAEPGTVDVQEPETAEAEEDNGLDFDLDFDLGEDVAAPAADTEADLADLEFELDGDASKAASDPDLSQMLDFNLETGSTAGQQAGHESDPDSVSAASEGHASGEAAMLDDVGLDLDLGALPELGEADDVESGEVDEGEGLLSDVDEVGTKLDLARAYLDMGDPDGARSILEEVRQEGNGDQQEEARTLLSQLA